MKRIIILLIATSLLAAGCSLDNDLKKSIMIYDPEYPELPIYSEWGYNTFGAYFDRDIFISNDTDVPAKLVATSTQATLTFAGSKNPYGSFGSDSYMALAFTFTGFSPKVPTDLAELHNRTFDLTSPSVQVTVWINGTQHTPRIFSGTLFVKRYQNLFVDKKLEEVILSGLFEMRMELNGKPLTLSNGRFDVGISPDNFFYK